MEQRAVNITNDGVNHKGAQIESRFITTIQGKDFVLYAGLLDLAHRKGLTKLLVEIIQLPSEGNGNTAICKAVAETLDGELYTDIGDANPTNTNKKIVHHLIRMASTRAKARCLRDLTNVGLCAVEELGDVNDDIPVVDVPTPTRVAANGYRVQNGNGNGASQVVPKASVAQVKAIQNIANRHKMADDALFEIIHENYGITALTDLTSTQAAELIRTLQKAS